MKKQHPAAVRDARRLGMILGAAALLPERSRIDLPSDAFDLLNDFLGDASKSAVSCWLNGAQFFERIEARCGGVRLSCIRVRSAEVGDLRRVVVSRLSQFGPCTWAQLTGPSKDLDPIAGGLVLEELRTEGLLTSDGTPAVFRLVKGDQS